MLYDLMEYYVLSRRDMALCMGVSFDCLNVLLTIKKKLPNLFNTRIGYATIILALGCQKFGNSTRFLKWLTYYLNKYDITAPIGPYVYMEIIRLLSVEGYASISYYREEFKPIKVIELPSCFNK
jgi:hypothetical protein